MLFNKKIKKVWFGLRIRLATGFFILTSKKGPVYKRGDFPFKVTCKFRKHQLLHLRNFNIFEIY